MNMKLNSVLFAIILVLTGCGIQPLAGLGLNLDTPRFQAIYDRTTAELDQKAKAGQITWVEAATRRKEADRNLAVNASKYDTSWKFDRYDEEFHAYCILMADKLDKRLISFAEFDLARTEKFNQIQERQATSSPARISSTPVLPNTGVLCILQNSSIATWGMGTHCAYSCAGSDYIQTVGAAQICPISIRK